MDYFEALFQRTAAAVEAAANACQDWELRGDADQVSDTAWDAEEGSREALEAVAGIDPSLPVHDYPETRLGRLVMAAHLLVLAGTDEGGRSDDLSIAARLFNMASDC